MQANDTIRLATFELIIKDDFPGKGANLVVKTVGRRSYTYRVLL